MSQVWDLDLPQPLKLLALALADWAEDDGGNIRPSVPYIARKVGASERTVQRQLRVLEASGIIEIEAERGYQLASGQWVRRLRLHPDKGIPLSPRGDILPPLASGKGVTPGATRGDTRRAKGVTPGAQRGDTAPSPNTSEIHQEITPGIREIATRPRDELWDRLVELGFAAPTNATERGRWNRALKDLRESGATPDLITERCRAWASHMPAGTILTVSGLAANWSMLGGPPPRAPGPSKVRDDLTRLAQLREEGPSWG